MPHIIPKNKFFSGADLSAAVFLLVLSVALMTFCSMASPLFPIHTGVDQNTFLTVGDAMRDGKIPYRDLFEQKGPLLYLLHAVAASLSPGSFTGVWILEIVSFFAFLLLLYRIARTLGHSRTAFPAAAVTGLITAVTYAFSKGDNAEEFCLPLIAAGLLALLRWTESDDAKMRSVPLFVSGVCAGCILWIKFTMLGFHIAFAGFVFFLTIRRGGIKAAFHSVFLFLGGMLLATVPWLAYFDSHHALGDFFEVYFYDNIFLYSGQLSVTSRIASIFTSDFHYNRVLFALIALGLLAAGSGRCLTKKAASRVCLLCSWFVLYFFLFAGGTRYRYYFLIMAVYALFGVLALLSPLETRLPDKPWLRRLLPPTITVLLTAACLPTSNCRIEYGRDKGDYPQFAFAQIMSNAPSLLNYRFLDGGFYLASGAPLPDTRYFCTVNIYKSKLPEMYDEQDALLQTSAVEYVVTRYELDGRPNDKEPPCAALEANYACIADAQDPPTGYGYKLYRRRGSAPS